MSNICVTINIGHVMFTLVIDQESHVSVLQSSVGQKDRVVRLHYGCGHLPHGSLVSVTCHLSHNVTHLGAGVDGEGQHRFLPVLHLEPLQQQRGEP